MAGNWSLTAVTGTVTPEVTRSRLKALTPGGCALLVIYFLVLIAMCKSGAKLLKGKIASGLVCGCLLGLRAAFSVVVSLALVTNTVGDKITGVVM
ncbi:hypothetical protein ACIRD6_37590 [Streptomyces sp. NPDC102473]|uniref:hypothetical protein n=1 Tax=Streptomyces sp. NPDC102473 TaxID=3366180 RepID=UPI0037F24172